MNGCHRCNFKGVAATCDEPTAGLSGFSSEPCECATPPCPRGICDGSGTREPHPATMGADAGIDDPCPCRDVAAPVDCAGCIEEVRTGGKWREHTCRQSDGPAPGSNLAGGGGEAPQASPLEAAWAARDRTHAALKRARASYYEAVRNMVRATGDFNRADSIAQSTGPRPAKVPT